MVSIRVDGWVVVMVVAVEELCWEVDWLWFRWSGWCRWSGFGHGYGLGFVKIGFLRKFCHRSPDVVWTGGRTDGYK